MGDTAKIPGGSFLIRESSPAEVFTPEDFSTDQILFAKTARDFMEKEVLPVSARLDAKEPGLARNLMAKAGELGLLMADIPEAYGGLELDKLSSALLAETMALQGSFAVIMGAHTGIGTLPIIYYGSEAAKAKYLPKLARGEWIGCYCLTEVGAGSDALSGRARATRDGDGGFVLNGTKQFITNGAIADVFIVFAKVDGEQFTGFICEKGMKGLSIGPEEHKMGISGSSTTSVILDDVRVPPENVLGEIGKGHKIAFNILNIGRMKLGFGCAGASKRALEDSLRYALERKQFGKPIAQFGVIREKLANMYARAFALEAACYRTVGYIDELAAAQRAQGAAALEAIEEYSVECAIVKVAGSETLDYVVDEAVQIYGGYGYCAEYPVERYYRDSRINRIFEGTNEINRLLIPAMLLRKGMKGEIPLFPAAKKLQDELMDIPSFDLEEDTSVLAAERKIASNLKKICLFTAGYAAQKYGTALQDRQEILARTADLAIFAYMAESALLRAKKDHDRRGDKAALPVAAARIVCEEAMAAAEVSAREALAAMAEGDTLTTLLAALRRLVRRTPADTVALREIIAARMEEDERVPFAM